MKKNKKNVSCGKICKEHVDKNVLETLDNMLRDVIDNNTLDCVFNIFIDDEQVDKNIEKSDEYKNKLEPKDSLSSIGFKASQLSSFVSNEDIKEILTKIYEKIIVTNEVEHLNSVTINIDEMYPTFKKFNVMDKKKIGKQIKEHLENNEFKVSVMFDTNLSVIKVPVMKVQICW